MDTVVSVIRASRILTIVQGDVLDFRRQWQIIGVPKGTELVRPVGPGIWEMSAAATRTAPAAVVTFSDYVTTAPASKRPSTTTPSRPLQRLRPGP
jgi:hypothetical protein